MPAAKPTPQPRRPIRRFELQDVRFNGRSSFYKDPQLVLKPQLDLVPRRPVDGSRLRMPLWRNYLMIHVKDRAEELVKLDLADFRPSEEPTDNGAPEQFIRRAQHEPVLYVQYPSNTQDGFSILRATLKVASDFETVLKEFDDLGINVDCYQEELRQDQSYSWSQPYSHSQNVYYHPTPNAMSPPLPPRSSPYSSSNHSHPYSSSPPYSIAPNPPYHYPNAAPDQLTYQRSASQPVGYPSSYQSQGQWSPPVMPSPAATTTGIPGVLGAGIYKVSKLGSLSSSRSRSRKSQPSRGGHGSAPGKHLDDNHQTTQSPSSGISSPHPLPDSSYSVSVPRRLLQRVQTIISESESQETISQASTLTSDYEDPSSRPFGGLRIPEEEETGEASSQQTAITTVASTRPATSTAMVPAHPNTSTEIVPYRQAQQKHTPPDSGKINMQALLRISQIQQEGLVDATRLWEDMMEKGRNAIAGVDDPEEAFRVLSGFQEEFIRRWTRVVASTVREMRDVENKSAM
ncbi:hypothetical protein QC762_407030 [Podospora pseudocomata]|uniref:Uncharacterized protein n=1 Tax=Podospora pseudocomata TaxID=2093779 RepID=A0ABR0GGF6_9PEZI|nr:hypothetical protein QC762_407030 [Podospora pseudocomata]